MIPTKARCIRWKTCSILLTINPLMDFRFFLVFVILFFSVWTEPTAAHDGESEFPFDRPHAHDAITGHFHFGWESRYASEGRDNWNGEDLVASSVELGYQHFSGGVWYGRSSSAREDELQISVAVSESTDEFEVYAGVTHLSNPTSHPGHDLEISAGLAWTGLPLGIAAGLDAYYSIDVRGSFWEAALSRDWSLSDPLTIEAAIMLGANQGYVSDGHDGANHISLRLGATLAISERSSLVVHGTQSWALRRNLALDGDSALRDFFHTGAGLQLSY